MSDAIGILRIPVVPNLAGFGAKVKAEISAVGKEAEKSVAPATTSVNRLGGAYDKAAVAAQRAGVQMQAAALRSAAAQDKATAATAKLAAAQAEASTAAAKLYSGELTVAQAAAKQTAATDAATRATQAQGQASIAAQRLILAQGAAEDKLAGQAAAAAAAQSKAADAAVAAQGKVVAAVGGLAAKVGRLSAAAVVGFAGYGAVAAADFQKLTNVYVTAAGESQKNLSTVQAGVLKVAENTGTAWRDVAAATYTAEKAGYRGADAYKVVESAAQGAKEENAKLSTVVDAVTSAMASYHLGASDSVRVTDELKAAAGESKSTFENFAGALSTVLPVASAFHVSLADVLGDFATLTQHGTSANESTQELAATIRALGAPTGAQQKLMAQLGIDANKVSADLGTEGLSGTLNYLTETILSKMGPAGTVLLNTFNQSKQASANAQTEFNALSPEVQKLATQFENGSISAFQYKKDLRGIGGEQGVLGAQFLTTYTAAHGFQSTLQQGLSQNKTYAAALKGITGGAIGLNTALQLTGESTKATTERVNKIAQAAKDAGTSVQGWASTQKLFSTQLDEFKQKAEVTAISLGTKILPVLQKIVGFLSKHQTALVDTVLAFAAAWTLVKVASIVSAVAGLATKLAGLTVAQDAAAASAGRLAVAEAGVGAAGTAAAAGSALPAASAAAGTGTAGRFLLPAAGGGIGRALAAGLEKSALTKIAIPVGLVVVGADLVKSLDKAARDIQHGHAVDGIAKILGSKFAEGLTFGLSGGIAKALKSKDWVDAIDPTGIERKVLEKFGIGGKLTGSVAPGGLKPPSPAPWNSFWSSVDDRGKIADFQDSLKNINTLVVQNSHTLVGNSYAATTNRAGITALVREAQSAASAYARTTGKQSDYTAALKLALPAIENAAAANGLNKQQVDNLINSLIRVPKETPANVTLTGTKEAQSELADLKQRLQDIARPIIIPIVAQAGLTGVASPNFTPTLPQILTTQNTNFGRSGPGGVPGGTGHAYGGVAKGWAKVGERGMELMHVGSPSAVLPHRETMAALGGGAPLLNIEHWHGDQTDADGLASMLNAKQRAYAASKGI